MWNANLQLNKPIYFTFKVPVKLALLVITAFICLGFGTVTLPDFNLQITITEETCPGNGTITCFTTNTDPSATITYRIYKLPNTTTPIAVLTASNFLGGLIAGDYRIVATQSLGAETNSQTQDVTIINQLVTLAYTVSGTAVTCNNNGTMTVHAFSGTPVSYEIISGPMLAPLQSSPTFTGLAAGVYQIRVFDNCGEGWVTTHTLFSALGTTLSLAETDQAEVVDCDQITITNTLSPETNASLTFPVTIVYTVYPPNGGAPIVTTTNLDSGDVSGVEFTTTIPYYSNLEYSYNVTVTDACGNISYFNNILVSKSFVAELRAPRAECGAYFLAFAIEYYKAPVTIQFLDFPVGFDPVAYNPAHPGPFSDATIEYGNATNGVPFGHYKAILTDACGRTVTVEKTLEYTPPIPVANIVQGVGCDSDTSTVKIKILGYTIDTAIIVSGPSTYSTNYPIDVTALINGDEGIEIENMPSGIYYMNLTDTCGNIYNNFEFIVPEKQTIVTFLRRPGCDIGFGSVYIEGSHIDLQSVILTAAPATYSATFPQNVSFNINAALPGSFSMNSLPEGTYTFDIVDSCGLSHTLDIPVSGYEITQNSYSIIPYCGSFDLDFNFVSNAPTTFWLQKFDPITNTWGQPQTGVPYVAGDIPNATNSYLIQNPNGTNYNISYLGDFRILTRLESFENGAVGLYKICSEVVQEFTFVNELHITDIHKVTCNGTQTAVSVTAVGLPPLTYQITTKDGQAFTVNNGNNNVFENLEPAIYNFRVFDTCGNIANQLTDVAQLPSLAQINQPNDLTDCDGTNNDNQSEFNLIGQNPAILGNGSPLNYNITYHASMLDATSDSNPLPDIYTSGNTTIYARVEYLSINTCYDITSFKLIVNPHPVLKIQLNQAICDGHPLTITADSGFDSYHWSTGENTQSITVNEPGIYTLEITQIINGIACISTYDIVVEPVAPPTIQHIETVDWTNNDNVISVILNQIGTAQYEYSLDGIHYQSENTFGGLETGDFTVYIRDTKGCDPIMKEVYLLGYPKFFTPNGDGFNDYWQIFFADSEPNMKIYIFDRYGKLLTGFVGSSVGWDGKLNGKALPSTDYWFLVIRENGTEHRGHFSMKR